MTTAIIVLLLVGLAVTLSIVRPAEQFTDQSPVDRDRERLLADLRARPDYRPDLLTLPRPFTYRGTR
jgi:hypothetical protein